MSRRVALGIVVGGLVVGGVVLAASRVGDPAPPIGDEPTGGSVSSNLPSIVVVMTDDQRWDTLGVMRQVQRHLVKRGVTFANSFVVDPLCCPSRASTLTGRYPHSTGVWLNTGPHGGFPAFEDRSTLATWLDGRGYSTGLFGKYLNQYEGTTYVPPGWDRWVAFDGSDDRADFYYRYSLNVDGRIQAFGDERDDYSTDVVGDSAVSFIRDTEGPVFVYFAPYAPHSPATPRPGDEDAFADLEPWRPPSYDEPDMSDKTEWGRSLNLMSAFRKDKIDLLRRNMLASLQAVDRTVGRLVDALRDTGRLGDTMFVFTSDNGLSLGEHRWGSKAVPWEESIRVPLVVRYDRLIEAPRTDERLVLNVDLAPTFAQIAGAETPGAEGRSLMPLLEGEEVGWRSDFGIESDRIGPRWPPAYCGLRTARYKYVVYSTGEAELYDLRRDPYELTNRAEDDRFADRVLTFQDRLVELCDPPPPGAPEGFPAHGTSP